MAGITSHCANGAIGMSAEKVHIPLILFGRSLKTVQPRPIVAVTRATRQPGPLSGVEHEQGDQKCGARNDDIAHRAVNGRTCDLAGGYTPRSDTEPVSRWPRSPWLRNGLHNFKANPA